MYFRILHDDASGELTYLLADLDAREAVLIDPRGRDLPVLQAMLSERELRLRWVLRTHHHDPLQPRRAGATGAVWVRRWCRVKPGVRHPLLPRVRCCLSGTNCCACWPPRGIPPVCLSFAWRDRLFCGGLLAVDACPHQPQPSRARSPVGQRGAPRVHPARRNPAVCRPRAPGPCCQHRAGAAALASLISPDCRATSSWPASPACPRPRTAAEPRPSICPAAMLAPSGQALS